MLPLFFTMRVLAALFFVFFLAVPAFAEEPSVETPFSWSEAVNLDTRTTLTPYTEWYILNELKALRTELQDIRRETIEQITNRELAVADRAVRYASDTVLSVFYIIALGAALLAIFGWKNFRDVKRGVKDIAESRIDELSRTYEKRLTALESELKEKSLEILSAQKEIENTQRIQSLWQQVNQEVEPRKRIDLLDQVLATAPDDTEALSAKLESVLDLQDWSWALSIANRLIEASPENGLAFYYRAAAQLGDGEKDAALEDLSRAFELAPTFKEQVLEDNYFDSIKKSTRFKRLLG